MVLQVHQFLCLEDNFGLLAHDSGSGATAAIDAPDGKALVAALKEKDWTLTHILITHHHIDHVQGIADLKAAFPKALVVGPEKEADKIPGLEQCVSEGAEIQIGEQRARVIETPGHTLGHIVYYFPDEEILFTGDTLFSLGCGRVFEGTMDMMYASLLKLANLLEETRFYCGHEYTLANARFALTIEPGNALLVNRVNRVKELREAGKFTLPSTIRLELETNPFLRSEEPEVQKAVGLPNEDPNLVFAALRQRKDAF